MMQGFESVEHELDQKRLHLEQELAALRGREAELEADLERVHDALGALTGHKKKSKGRARTRKPATSVQDVQQHIAHVREQSPFADAGMLEKAVRELVKASGSSLSGFKTLFAEALLTSPGSHAGAGQHAPHPHAHGTHPHSDGSERYSA